MALGTAVTEVVIRLTGAWPPALPEHLIESEDAKMSQESPVTSCFVAAGCRYCLSRRVLGAPVRRHLGATSALPRRIFRR
jgi:hypothetical protein